MGPLRTWLQSVDLTQFEQAYLGREPISGANIAAAAARTCTWRGLDRMLRALPDDVLVVARGRHLELPAPRTLRELGTLFAAGQGLAIRKAERHSPGLARLCAEFGLDLPGEQRVIAFATPAQTHGFGWHYDAEDVFIVQTQGDKEYLFRRNTVCDASPRSGQPDFSLHARETSPVMSCRLIAGDWLYIPRGFWHVAYAHRHSLSISIGVLPAARCPVSAWPAARSSAGPAV
jgi:50S ribosomal protein L16 3-hydroxylase